MKEVLDQLASPSYWLLNVLLPWLLPIVIVYAVMKFRDHWKKPATVWLAYAVYINAAIPVLIVSLGFSGFTGHQSYDVVRALQIAAIYSLTALAPTARLRLFCFMLPHFIVGLAALRFNSIDMPDLNANVLALYPIAFLFSTPLGLVALASATRHWRLDRHIRTVT